MIVFGDESDGKIYLQVTWLSLNSGHLDTVSEHGPAFTLFIVAFVSIVHTAISLQFFSNEQLMCPIAYIETL